MVVFTCGHCGESVQKPKVEKHYLTKCRNRNPNLSCMDCFKDFLGNDYDAHVKCITEEQRYSGKGFVAKEKKGEKKQNVWVEMLQSVLDEQKNAPKNVLRIIETISKHNNTPRKKPKFVNFVKNVCGAKTNPKDIDQAWDLISVKLSELSKSVNGDQCKNNDASEANSNEEKNYDEDKTVKETKDEIPLNDEIPPNHEYKDSKLIENGEQNGNAKKTSKKQRKEEKKRLKYEAELQKAAEPPTEIEEKENQPTKKDKKKKNKNDIGTCDENGDGTQEGKNKIKKRKRQDTVNGVVEVNEQAVEPVVVENGNKEKTQKKKPKVGDKDFADESVCLHDQNVAATTESEPKNEKFDWHAVILSVLRKKGNELPFKRLQKKVLGEYSEATGQEVDDRIAEKFIKKIKSAPKVKVDKNRVVLEE